MNEKREIEKATIEYFLPLYNSLKRTDFEDISGDSQDKPDFLIKSKNPESIIGVETTTLFYDGEEAKMLLGRSNKRLHGVMNSGDAIDKLKKRIKEKDRQAKQYRYSGEIILVIRNASPIFSSNDLMVKNLSHSLFKEIWLISRAEDNRGNSLVRLQ